MTEPITNESRESARVPREHSHITALGTAPTTFDKSLAILSSILKCALDFRSASIAVGDPDQRVTFDEIRKDPMSEV